MSFLPSRFNSTRKHLTRLSAHQLPKSFSIKFNSSSKLLHERINGNHPPIMRPQPGFFANPGPPLELPAWQHAAPLHHLIYIATRRQHSLKQACHMNTISWSNTDAGSGREIQQCKDRRDGSHYRQLAQTRKRCRTSLFFSSGKITTPFHPPRSHTYGYGYNEHQNATITPTLPKPHPKRPNATKACHHDNTDASRSHDMPSE